MAFYQEMGTTFLDSRVMAFRSLPDNIPFVFNDCFEPYTAFNLYMIQKATGSWASPHSKIAAAQAYKHFLTWTEANGVEWDEVRYRHLVFYRDQLVREGLQSSTINHRLTFIHQFYHWSADCGLITHFSLNFRDLRVSDRIQAGTIKFLEQEDLIKFLRACNYAFESDFTRNQNELMAVIMACVGLRRQEVVKLTVDHIPSFDPRRPYQYGEVLGKGNKRRAVQWPTQVINSVETFITFHRRPLIEDFMEKDTSYDAENYLFLSSKTGKPFHYNSLNKIFTAASKACGVKCTPHMLRHTYATYWLKENGVSDSNIIRLRNLLGHSHSDTTFGYVHALERLVFHEEVGEWANFVARRIGLDG
jgi:site-specific recombinase XerD